MTARHILFIGRVQGVGFRYTVLGIAERQGLTGFVRNLPDESVEMLAQGSAEQIDLCLEEIRSEFGRHIRQEQAEQVPVNPRYTVFRIVV